MELEKQANLVGDIRAELMDRINTRLSIFYANTLLRVSAKARTGCQKNLRIRFRARN